MKNSEIIKLVALFIITGALLYRKYAKKTGNKVLGGSGLPGKTPFAPHPPEEEYEPYSKKDKIQ